MKCKISITDLQYAMRTVKDVVPSSGPLADAAGVSIAVKKDRAIFTAFNLEMLVKAIVKVEGVEDGEIVTDAAALFSAISHFKPLDDEGVGTTDITLVVGKRSKKLQLTAKTVYANGKSIPHKRVFPLKTLNFMPGLPSDAQVKLSFEMCADTLMDGIDSVAYALSKEDHQPVFTGMFFKLEDKKLTLFATNGVCLAEYKSPVEYSGEAQQLVIPGAFAQKISKSFFEGNILKFSLTENMLYVRTPNLILGGTLIREEYPDYTAIIPKPKFIASVDRYILLDNLLNLSYEASQTEANRVRLSLRNGEASLVCGSSHNNGIPGESEQPIEFDCNLKLFASSVKNVFGEALKVGFVDSDTLLQFSSDDQSADGASLTCMLVPLSK